jgi:hypothetical protein
VTHGPFTSGVDVEALRSIDRSGCRRDSSGFHYARSSRISNHFPTKRPKPNSARAEK